MRVTSDRKHRVAGSCGRAGSWTAVAVLVALLALSLPASPAGAAASCERYISADVVALDQPFWWNRLGAAQPQGMIYALEHDVEAIDGGTPGAGNARLKAYKRARPLVLRVNVGDCLTINFTNWLSPGVPGGVNRIPPSDHEVALPRDEQPATRAASVHVMGLELMGGVSSDGSNVGRNASSLVAPGESAVYTLYAARTGTFLLHSGGAIAGGEGDGGSISAGLFGAVNVEPAGAEWYRSQVTQDDLARATTDTTLGGHPIVDYGAVYADGPRAGLPIFAMLQAGKIVHSDLNAIITGPGRGWFVGGTYPSNPVYPDRNRPYREFTVIFHDEIGAVQAFQAFDDPVLHHTLHSVRDGFAINYGTGGIGSEILANRFGVGPMADCVDCKYEEFFLTSWAVGDPAMVVDIPANAGCGADCTGATGPKATKAFFPDDPSNVFHSYLNDQVVFRNLHAGPKEHHIFHLHAHQWLNSPDSDNSAYLDSQHIGPGAGFSYPIAHGGSGNRNRTPGDSIFHCHFYPHFAQGMWALWRVHDVFETGTLLDAQGRPAPGSRALPDAEILAGTPIPAVVPLPGLVMPPMPQAVAEIEWVTTVDPVTSVETTSPTGQVKVTGPGNPGYPFFIPGIAGHRPPTPPLDIVDDGGLPRHVIHGGKAHSTVTRLDMSKELLTASAIQLPEDGDSVEKAAMAFHAERTHLSYKPDGTAGDFVTNGMAPQPGAPFADPCQNDAGYPAGNTRTYKSASIQLDMKINKLGWHFPQSRINILWGDVAPTLAGQRAPEPLFFRANTNDCITFHHANLIPHVYEQDDFQVRTPTDVIGQHIHLVKFDVTASDGSGNGFNYEDGTLAPGEVIERINAINAAGGSWLPTADGPAAPAAAPHPFFGVLGARTTVQRWYADDVVNRAGNDRTLRTVFTHDHYGPSTHQQVGLYSSLVLEPAGSTWWANEQNVQLGVGRFDGGPTSWQARIVTANPADSYREFLFHVGDFMLAYRPDGTPVNPPARQEIGLPFLVQVAPQCPGGVPRPCPEAISADDPGTLAVNYRQEPLALRVRDPRTNTQAVGLAGDLAHAFRSDVNRAEAALNSQPGFYPPLTAGVQPGDPFTPILRVYEADRVQVRVQVGSTEESHNMNLHGVKWLYQPSWDNSGYRSSQGIGISEHFEFLVPTLAVKGSLPSADYLYEASASVDGRWNGAWGLMRAYNGGAGLRPDLLPLPNNSDGKAPNVANPRDFAGVCPRSAPTRNFSITAVTAAQALPGGTLVYNSRSVNGGPLHDPTAILYVQTKDLNKTTGALKAGVPVEPLVLRANAGDCINVTLVNQLPAAAADLAGFSTLPMIVDHFNANQVAPSSHVGLHAQLLARDVTSDDGANVGLNPVQTVPPGGTAKYKWYAGDFGYCEGGMLNAKPSTACSGKPDGTLVGTPIEFGAVNLMPADPIKQVAKGLVGALVIEPQGSTWVEDAGSRAAATVTKADGITTFREFVVVFQDSVNLRYNGNEAVPNVAEAEDSEDSGQKALNYRSEPFWLRMGFAPNTPLTTTRTLDFSQVLSNLQVGNVDPQTPVFAAKKGDKVRFRVLHPGGHARNHVFAVHGHGWELLPYTLGSTVIGDNPLSGWTGSLWGHGPTNHADVVLRNGAGGPFQVTGDYLYRDQPSFQFGSGLWGIFRVVP